MKIILSHPTGNQNSRAAALGLVRSKQLEEFHTSLAVFPNSMFSSLSHIKPLSELKRRSFDPSLQPYTKLWPWRETGRLLASRIGNKKLTAHEFGVFSVDAVYQSLDKRVANRLKNINKRIDAIYAYEDGALNSFKEAKKLAIKCFYDHPVCHWRMVKKLLEIEKERWPEWQKTLTGLKNSDQKLARKDEELRLADCIYVASSFSAESLREFPGTLNTIKVIPYGFPPVAKEKDYSGLHKKNRLKLLFVGGLTQQKGLAHLFEAVDAIGDAVELTLVGRGDLDCKALKTNLAKHRWVPSLPHSEVLKIMRENDVLIFPSLFEGYGMVISEAMSQGTPVITTNRTAGPDLIENGVNGWIIGAGSTKLLQNAIEALLNFPEQIMQAGLAAMQTARNRPWEVYGSELADSIRDQSGFK